MDFGGWLYWFDSSGWLGLLGFLLTLIGFGVTYIGVRKTRMAADAAKEAAQGAIVELQTLRVASDLSAAITELEEIRRLYRNDEIKELPERLSKARKLLIVSRSKHPSLSVADSNAISQAVVAFSEMEKQLYRVSRGHTPNAAAKINASLIDRIDQMIDIMSKLI